jgi:hypothetical protein
MITAESIVALTIKELKLGLSNEICSGTNMLKIQAAEIISLPPSWRIANPITVVIKIISHASRGGNFIRQTIAFVVIHSIGGIKVIWTIVEVIRAVIEVVRAIVKVIRAVFKVVS